MPRCLLAVGTFGLPAGNAISQRSCPASIANMTVHVLRCSFTFRLPTFQICTQKFFCSGIAVHCILIPWQSGGVYVRNSQFAFPFYNRTPPFSGADRLCGIHSLGWYWLVNIFPYHQCQRPHFQSSFPHFRLSKFCCKKWVFFLYGTPSAKELF